MRTGQQIGPFLIEGEIGAGAMGAVYRARYTKTGKPVAIKIVAAGLDTNPTSLARFERESEILKKLRHPHVVRLYATGRMQGKPFYAMELVEGEPLDQILERRGRLPWEEVVSLGTQICSALQHAHEQGIVHRDLKPSNLMVTPDGTVKLMDFGIAKMLDVVQLTATNTTVGTAAYMSPEQCRGEKILTPKSDLYSLGVVFYELLTGRRPFLAETTLDMFLSHVQGSFERPSRLVLDIPIWLDTLVCQLLEKDPHKRPLSAAAVAEALGQIRDKVAAQRSAGVDVVSTNVGERPRTDLRADDEDRRAARVLKAAVSRKRLRKKLRPLPQRPWFQAACLLAGLALVAAAWYWVTRPPSADTLIRRFKHLAGPETSDRAAARAAAQQLLDTYPTLDNEETRQARRFIDDFDARKYETVLWNRMRVHMLPKDDMEAAARSGLTLEEEGRLSEARDRWKQLVHDTQGGNGREAELVAQAHLRIVERAEALAANLRDRVQRARLQHQPINLPDDAEKRAASALRFSLFGDQESAIKQWQAVRNSAETSGDRALYLVAVKELGALDREKPLPRLEVVREQMQLAEQKRSSEPLQAELIWHEVITLYGEDKDHDLQVQVRRAERLIAQMSGR